MKEDFLRQGLTASRAGRYQEATGLYGKAIAQDPLNFLAYNNLGVVFSKTGNSTQAEDHFRKAIEINPNYPDAYYNLGVLLSERGDASHAEYFLERSCSLGITDGCNLLKKLKGR